MNPAAVKNICDIGIPRNDCSPSRTLPFITRVAAERQNKERPRSSRSKRFSRYPPPEVLSIYLFSTVLIPQRLANAMPMACQRAELTPDIRSDGRNTQPENNPDGEALLIRAFTDRPPTSERSGSNKRSCDLVKVSGASRRRCRALTTSAKVFFSK